MGLVFWVVTLYAAVQSEVVVIAFGVSWEFSTIMPTTVTVNFDILFLSQDSQWKDDCKFSFEQLLEFQSTNLLQVQSSIIPSMRISIPYFCFIYGLSLQGMNPRNPPAKGSHLVQIPLSHKEILKSNFSPRLSPSLKHSQSSDCDVGIPSQGRSA